MANSLLCILKIIIINKMLYNTVIFRIITNIMILHNPTSWNLIFALTFSVINNNNNVTKTRYFKVTANLFKYLLI